MPSELGNFLRARRADVRLAPAHANESGRRRLPGLRREEVATAAGISVDYYTRLEQGRESNPSESVVTALARALHLSADAHEYLLHLRQASPSSPASRIEGTALGARMSAMVAAVSPNPAYVLDRLSNMVAANAEGLALYDGFAALAPEDRNTCRYLLTDPRARQVFVEWEPLARGAVAQLRAANSDDLRNPELQALVAELRTRSPEFEEWWDGHLVERRRGSVTHIRSGTAVVARHYEVLHLPDDSLRMTLWLPAT